MEEISMLGSLSSPYIVSYIDSFVQGTKVNIIMEYCELGDLQSLIVGRLYSLAGQSAFGENVIWRYFI